jgi:hypothetical protein
MSEFYLFQALPEKQYRFILCVFNCIICEWIARIASGAKPMSKPRINCYLGKDLLLFRLLVKYSLYDSTRFRRQLVICVGRNDQGWNFKIFQILRNPQHRRVINRDTCKNPLFSAKHECAPCSPAISNGKHLLVFALELFGYREDLRVPLLFGIEFAKLGHIEALALLFVQGNFAPFEEIGNVNSQREFSGEVLMNTSYDVETRPKSRMHRPHNFF